MTVIVSPPLNVAANAVTEGAGGRSSFTIVPTPWALPAAPPTAPLEIHQKRLVRLDGQCGGDAGGNSLCGRAWRKRRHPGGGDVIAAGDRRAGEDGVIDGHRIVLVSAGVTLKMAVVVPLFPSVTLASSIVSVGTVATVAVGL